MKGKRDALRDVPKGYKLVCKRTKRQLSCRHVWEFTRNWMQCMYCRLKVQKLPTKLVKVGDKPLRPPHCIECREPFTRQNPNFTPNWICMALHEQCFWDYKNWKDERQRDIVLHTRTVGEAAIWAKICESQRDALREESASFWEIKRMHEAAKAYASDLRQIAWNERRNAKRREKRRLNARII